jgi:hypothetical protein
MEKEDFNQSWKNAFEDAEVTPSDSVWTNIELDLEKAAGGKMKQRLLFYKLLAAASFVFAMGIAGVYYLGSSEDSNSNRNSAIVKAEEGGVPDSVTNPSSAVPEVSEVRAEQSAPHSTQTGEQLAINQDASVNQNRPTRSGRNGATNRTVDATKTTLTSGPVMMTSEQTANSSAANASIHKTFFDDLLGRPKSALTDFRQPSLARIEPEPEPESNADPGMVLLARLQDEEKKYQEKEKQKSTEKIWTSVGFAAGSFNPNTTNSTATQSSTFGSNQSSFASNPSSGSSYSLGLQVGGRITNRLVILGGISYLTQNAAYTSNMASMEATNLKATLNDHAFSDYNLSVTTSPYGINSNLQYVSLPVQAGYIVVDRKFSVQLNGGVATDFFMLNTLTPDVDNVDKVSQGPGEDSPYRPVTFSGLVGTEFSYRFTDRYRVALNPGIRYSLKSIYKADVFTEVSPITYDVALRFRYIFK